MLSKISALGALGVLALGVAALPVKADTATVQQSTQETIITGDGNDVDQRVRQESQIRTRVNSRSDDGSSIGTVQDGLQVTDVFGDDNEVDQVTDQYNEIEERRGARGRGRSNIEINQ